MTTFMMADTDTISNRDIIMIGQQPWDTSIGSNSKNIAVEFSKNNRVLYVNRPLDRITKIKYASDPLVKKRIDIINKKETGLISIKPQLWAYYPDAIVESINWIGSNFIYNILNRFNNKRFAKSIRKAIDELGFKDFILFNDNDIFNGYYLKDLLGPQISIYYSRDYLLTVRYWKRHGKILEPKLIAKNDVCVANSVSLANYCRKFNDNSYYVGQGCDIDDFTGYKGEAPADITVINRPVIGYIGAIQELRLDIELLKYIAQQRPGYSIVLVGPEDEGFKNSDLHNINNVYFLGTKPAEQVPAYVNEFDVCLNPQVINEVTKGNYPRKIDEYLAMGKPVVATKTEAMSIFEEHTYLCDTHDEYIAAIDRALQEDSPELQQSRIKFAATHTWENSVNEIYRAIKLTGTKTKPNLTGL
jgi:teichuronic acid biosynthesis glycosyltransferase TuaH